MPFHATLVFTIPLLLIWNVTVMSYFKYSAAMSYILVDYEVFDIDVPA